MSNKDGRLAGKVAFITGAGSGIARAAAGIFAREGASVVIAELKTDLGRASEEVVKAAGGEATFIQTDVTKEDSVRQSIAAAGQPSYAICPEATSGAVLLSALKHHLLILRRDQSRMSAFPA